jgi:signal transduction histidine kinase
MDRSKEPTLLSAFNEYLRKINIFQLRIFCVLAFTLVPLFSILDYYISPAYFKTFLVIRLACTVAIILLFLLSFTAIGKKHVNLIGGAAPLFIGGTISLIIRYVGGYESSYYAGLNLVMLGVATLYAWEVKLTAAICITIYGFYLIPILLYDRIDHPELLVNNNAFLLSTMVIAFISAYFLSRLRYQEFEGRYQLEESRRALQISNEKLQTLGDLKSQFFADISHELRTPLAVIRGEAEVTLRGKDKPVGEYKQVLGYIILLVEQLHKLVSDLLFLARSESGTIQIEKRTNFLKKILDEAHREGEILALRKEMKILFKDQSPREVLIKGDAQRLKQLFLIVIDNAIYYSSNGGCVAISLQEEGQQVRVVISDNGIGISEESLPHVFERFYRGERSKSMASGGAGLGLAIAKWIAEAHEGSISIASVLGKGTEVTILLPLSGRAEV